MRRYRRSQPEFICAGCQTTHKTSIPFFTGPEDAEGHNLYCAASHPDKPMQAEKTVLSALYHYGREKGYSISVMEKNEMYLAREQDADLVKWDYMIECGKSYLVGRDVDTKEFLRKHTSTITTAWMTLAVQYVSLNPKMVVYARSGTLDYRILKVGEYVEIGLPHQDMGGEKHWITKDGQHKVLINVD